MEGQDILSLLNHAAANQVTQIGFYFTLAAWIHSRQVKKQFENVTAAINGLGEALRGDLGALSKRIDATEKRLDTIQGKPLDKP